MLGERQKRGELRAAGAGMHFELMRMSVMPTRTPSAGANVPRKSPLPAGSPGDAAHILAKVTHAKRALTAVSPQARRCAAPPLAREHRMRCRVRRGTLDDVEARCVQVQPGKQRFPLPAHDGCKGQVHPVDQAGPKTVSDRVHAATDLHVLVARARAGCASADSMPSVTNWKVVPPSSR